jgi:phosphoglycolate phosphatase
VNLIFDLDGTLTDPREGILACFKHALSALGAGCVSDRALEDFIGPPLRESFAGILGDGNRALVEQAVALYRERFAAQGLFENKPYPGIDRLLAQLDERGDRLFVATVKPGVFAERIVRHFGFKQYFRAVYGSELDGTNTDKGVLVAHMLEEQSLDSADSILIGDRASDVAAARANRILSIGVLWGYGSKQELIEARANWLCEKPRVLAQIVGTISYDSRVSAVGTGGGMPRK